MLIWYQFTRKMTLWWDIDESICKSSFLSRRYLRPPLTNELHNWTHCWFWNFLICPCCIWSSVFLSLDLPDFFVMSKVLHTQTDFIISNIISNCLSDASLSYSKNPKMLNPARSYFCDNFLNTENFNGTYRVDL